MNSTNYEKKLSAKAIKYLVLASSVVGMMSVAHAQVAVAQSGFYLQGQGNYTGLQNFATAGASTTSKQPWGYGFGVGFMHALNLNSLLGIEINYADMGSYSANANIEGTALNQTFRNYGYEGLLKLEFLAQDGFNIFIKGGMADAVTKAVYSTDSLNGSQKQNSWVPVGAVGLGYQPSPNLEIFAQVKHYFGSNWENVTPTVSNNNVSYNFPAKTMRLNVLSLGLAYNFPTR